MFKLGEPGVVDGTTANLFVASYRGPRQDGQVAKTNPGAPGCLRILNQSLRTPDLRDFDLVPNSIFRGDRRSSRSVSDWFRDR